MIGKSLALIFISVVLAAPSANAGQISVVNPGTIFFYTPPTPTPISTPVPSPTVGTPVVATGTTVPITNVIAGVPGQSGEASVNSGTPSGSALNVPLAAVQQFNPSATLSVPQMQIAMTQIQAILAAPSGLTAAQVTTLQSHLALMQAGLNK